MASQICGVLLRGVHRFAGERVTPLPSGFMRQFLDRVESILEMILSGTGRLAQCDFLAQLLANMLRDLVRLCCKTC